MAFEEKIRELTTVGATVGLDRIEQLLEKKNNPQNELQIIHIAGTNGKGSTSAMLSSILVEAGKKVGFFSSPYIKEVNEEFKINNNNITTEKLMELLNGIELHVKEMDEKPTEFELRTALALEYFKEEECEIVLLETGLGGTNDATNVVKKPLLTVITKIGIDHTSILGKTIEEITEHKGGIVKEDVPCVVMEQEETVLTILKRICRKKNVEYIQTRNNEIKIESITLNGTTISYKGLEKIRCSLIGTPQVENMTLVIEAVDTLNQMGIKISEENIRVGLEKTSWAGRFDVIKEEPLFIVDGAHNVQGVEAFTQTLEQVLPNIKFTILMGLMADKEYKLMIEKLIPYAKEFVTISPKIPRAMSAVDLAEEIKKQCSKEVTAFQTIEEGVQYAQREQSDVCCVGSLYMLSEVIEFVIVN